MEIKDGKVYLNRDDIKSYIVLVFGSECHKNKREECRYDKSRTTFENCTTYKIILSLSPALKERVEREKREIDESDEPDNFVYCPMIKFSLDSFIDIENIKVVLDRKDEIWFGFDEDFAETMEASLAKERGENLTISLDDESDDVVDEELDASRGNSDKAYQALKELEKSGTVEKKEFPPKKG